MMMVLSLMCSSHLRRKIVRGERYWSIYVAAVAIRAARLPLLLLSHDRKKGYSSLIVDCTYQRIFKSSFRTYNVSVVWMFTYY